MSLPDEIVSEILSPALKVSDEVFSDTSTVSPFAEYAESSSAYLLVCKSWLRVATPLLYHVVILRSKAQAKALGQALKKNQQLGQFIKKLRLEGGYGAPMEGILKLSPNIVDLFISFEIWSPDSTGGLCKGLLLINPTRLILRDSRTSHGKRSDNKMTLDLEDTLVQAISKWDRLSIVDLPYQRYDQPDRAMKVVNALVQSRRLQTLVVCLHGIGWAYHLLKTCPLQSIRVKEAVNPASLAEYLARANLDGDPALKALLKVTERQLPAVKAPREIGTEHTFITPSLNPSFIPMSAASEEVQDTIWQRILYFAMSVPELALNPRAKNPPSRLPLLFVSKKFNRLALPYLYTYVGLKNFSAISKFSLVLHNNPSVGARVHTLFDGMSVFESNDPRLYSESDSDCDSDDASDGVNSAPRVDTLLPLLSQLTGLVRIRGFPPMTDIQSIWAPSHFECPISWEAFGALARASGSTLRELTKPVERADSPGVSAAVFNDLRQLRILDWDCMTAFDGNVDTLADGLPNLVHLRVRSADTSFFTALSHMKLPALRFVSLSSGSRVPDSEKFLRRHGSKLTEIHIPHQQLPIKTFEICPNLKLITFPLHMALESAPQLEKFLSRTANCSLEKIKISLRLWYNDKKVVANWDPFFAGLDPKRLPNLREVEFPSFEWPTSERDIAKSHWVRWAEDLLKRNIHLTDKHGKKWRPRLKTRK